MFARILTILVLSAALEAHAQPSFEDYENLSNETRISYETGVHALAEMPNSLTNKITSENIEDLRLRYHTAHNRIFIKTHIARLTNQIAEMPAAPDRPRWLAVAQATRLKNKQEQLELFQLALTQISQPDFDHRLHLFSTLDDLGRAFSLGLSLLSGQLFSQNVSKSGLSGLISMRMVRDQQRLLPERRLSPLIETEAAPSELKIQPSIVSLRLQIEEKPFANQPLNAAMKAFLTRLGISDWSPTTTSRDLSHAYRIPGLQQRSAACVGFAVSSDIEFELNRIQQLQADTVSPWITYGLFRYREAGLPPPTCLEIEAESQVMASGDWPLHDGIYDVPGSIRNLKENPLCLLANGSVSGHVAIQSFEEYGSETENLSFNLLRAMIDGNQPPILRIKSDARKESEDWLQLSPFGQFQHVLVVVGYGDEEVNPFTLKRESYFLVRDSLGKKAIHYRISGANLLDNSLGITKITGVSRE